jgi:transposase
MQVVHARCCGLDVHKKTVVACVLITADDGSVQRQVRTFSTMTSDLLALSDWLTHQQVEQIALESTGVYWRPVFNLLEGDGRTIVLVNAQHMKAVPGRKTDVKDSEWLADLLRHGLVRASFIPPAPIRALRDLTRYRKTLVQERSQEVQRLEKVLETANVKLTTVATDVLGVSGRHMIEALIAGKGDATTLAELAKGRLRQKLPALRQALDGRLQPHHRVLLVALLGHIDYLEQTIAQLQDAIAERLAAVEEAVALLQTVPAVGPTAAATIVSEIGADMSRFPSAKHLASWAGLCPGNHESAGKRLSGKTTKGDKYLRTVLCEVAWGVARSPGTYLHAQYHRLARRRGKARAVVAVAHSLLVAIYHVLATHQPYADLGPDYFDQLDASRLERHYVRRLEQLGYAVTLAPQVA